MSISIPGSRLIHYGALPHSRDCPSVQAPLNPFHNLMLSFWLFSPPGMGLPAGVRPVSRWNGVSIGGAVPSRFCDHQKLAFKGFMLWCAGAVRGLAAMGPRVVRLLMVPHMPAYSALLDKALTGGRPSSVRRLEAERVRSALLSAFRLAWSAPESSLYRP